MLKGNNSCDQPSNGNHVVQWKKCCVDWKKGKIWHLNWTLNNHFYDQVDCFLNYLHSNFQSLEALDHSIPICPIMVCIFMTNTSKLSQPYQLSRATQWCMKFSQLKPVKPLFQVGQNYNCFQNTLAIDGYENIILPYFKRYSISEKLVSEHSGCDEHLGLHLFMSFTHLLGLYIEWFLVINTVLQGRRNICLA